VFIMLWLEFSFPMFLSKFQCSYRGTFGYFQNSCLIWTSKYWNSRHRVCLSLYPSYFLLYALQKYTKQELENEFFMSEHNFSFENGSSAVGCTIKSGCRGSKSGFSLYPTLDIVTYDKIECNRVCVLVSLYETTHTLDSFFMWIRGAT
jgi:hypothetical protein